MIDNSIIYTVCLTSFLHGLTMGLAFGFITYLFSMGLSFILKLFKI